MAEAAVAPRRRGPAPEAGAAFDLRAVTIGVLGGAGDQGRALAARWAAAGGRILLGSRDPARAEAAAAELNRSLGVIACGGMSNATAAAESDIAVIAVPYSGHADLLRPLASALAGKIIIDCVNPVAFDEHGPHRLPVPEGSAAEQAAALLPGSRVVAAFHHLSAVLLADPTVASIDSDVLVLGDDREAVGIVQVLAGAIPGVRAVYAGRLRNAGQVEALTANLIAVNRRYKVQAGVRLTDI